MSINVAKLVKSEKRKIGPNEGQIIQDAIETVFVFNSTSISNILPVREKSMPSALDKIEQFANEYSSSVLYTLTGIGWENFTAWFLRKDQDKRTPLNKAIRMYHEALRINGENTEAQIALATILVENAQVRDLVSALSILNQIQDKTSNVQGLITKAKRWIGEIELESNFNYSSFKLNTLYAFREERTKCRVLVRSIKKEKKYNELSKVLEHMYRIAILHEVATYLIHRCGYDLNTSVDKVWDKEFEKITKKIHSFSYVKNGKLYGFTGSNNSFFSENDYKTFDMIFGETDKEFDPTSLIDENIRTYMDRMGDYLIYGDVSLKTIMKELGDHLVKIGD